MTTSDAFFNFLNLWLTEKEALAAGTGRDRANEGFGNFSAATCD